jgi:hypothetical protein
MPPKDPRVDFQTVNSEATLSLRRVERFLRVLTWQMFGLLAILLLVWVTWLLRPQPGRYQYIGEKGGVVVVDTALPYAMTIKLEEQKMVLDQKTEPEALPAEGERQD